MPLFVIPGLREAQNPESSLVRVHPPRSWIPDRRCAASGMTE
jgi:hypothetical protein